MLWVYRTFAAALVTGGLLDVPASGSEPILSFGYGPLTEMTLSHAGSTLVTGSQEGDIRVWQFRNAFPNLWRNETPVVRKLPGHTGAVSSLAFTPDDQLLASASEDGPALLWEVAEGRLLHRLDGHSDRIHSMAFSLDGSLVGTASEDGTARLWDVATGEQLRAYAEHTDAVNSIGFVEVLGITFIATGSSDSTVRIWDAATGETYAVLSGHADAVRSVEWVLENGIPRSLVSGADDGTAIVWDLTRQSIAGTLSAHTGPILDIDASTDGQTIATASADGSAMLWNANAPSERVYWWNRHADALHTVLFSPRSSSMLTGGFDNDIQIWSTSNPLNYDRLFGHSSEVNAIAVPDSSGSPYALVGMEDGRVLYWSLERNEANLSARTLSGAIQNLGYAFRGSELVAGSDDGNVMHWGFRLPFPRTMQVHEERVSAVAYSPVEDYALTGTASGSLTVWNTYGYWGEFLTCDHNAGTIHDIDFSSDGTLALVGSEQGYAFVVDSLFCISVQRRLTGHTGAVYSVDISPDDSLLLTGSADGTSKIWDTSGRTFRTLRGHNGSVNAVAFSPDGARVATGSDDGTAKLWNSANGVLLRTYEGHTGPINDVSFSPTRDWIITGSDDYTVKVWPVLEAEGEGEAPGNHTADTNQNSALELGELMRIVQLFNSGRLGCATDTEDGFAPGVGPEDCSPHASDYEPQDWVISLSEMLRGVQLFQLDQIETCAFSEDGFCPAD